MKLPAKNDLVPLFQTGAVQKKRPHNKSKLCAKKLKTFNLTGLCAVLGCVCRKAKSDLVCLAARSFFTIMQNKKYGYNFFTVFSFVKAPARG